jgi:hydroxymethylbilane synthase
MEVIIGSRASELAMVQSEHVAALLRRSHPDVTVVIRSVVSKGDKVLDRPLSEIQSTGGLFTTELEEGLLNGSYHLAVHSLKDMPTALPTGLMLAAVTSREDPRDVLLVNPKHKTCTSLSQLPKGAVIGSSSLRRQAFLAKHHPTLVCKSIRGNLQTRLRKLDEVDGEYDGVILAKAGVCRLGWDDRIACVLDEEAFPHAVGQGALGIECKVDNEYVKNLVVCLEDAKAGVMCRAERAMLNTLQGGCQVADTHFSIFCICSNIYIYIHIFQQYLNNSCSISSLMYIRIYMYIFILSSMAPY